MGSVQVNLVGIKFDKLTVVNKEDSRKYGHTKKRMWRCVCDCGNYIVVPTSALTSGNTSSCGCYKSITNAENSRNSRHKIAKKDAQIRSRFASYISNATARNLSFTLTVDEFYGLITSNCYYCNSEPSNTSKIHYYKIKCSGIDRLDNSIGYTLENCVSCCKMCNIAKNNHTFDEFIEWSFKLSENLIKKAKEKLKNGK